MRWDEESLEYGYVLARPPDGGWWHLHFGRSDVSYYCELLGGCTDVLACVQWFSAWAVAKSPQFFLTLDGEGVEVAAEELLLNFGWGKDGQGPELLEVAFHFQREVIPLLYDNPSFQRAIAEVVHCQRHLCVVRLDKLGRREPLASADDPNSVS